jgi:hypothetical protein
LITTLQRAKALVDETRNAWSTYALGKLAPLARLMDLAAELPGAQDVLTQPQSYLAGLNAGARVLPRSAEDVQLFHARLFALEQTLTSVSQFTDEQQAFINKLRSGTATVQDLTPALLAWCQEKGLARTMKIMR